MLNLSPTQKKIVQAPFDQAIQILASAGSGKTRVLTERIRYILENTKQDGVLALTFTVKAAEEMMLRLEDCDQVEDRTWIATTHSVAQRILESYGHMIGLPEELHIYDRDRDRMEVFLQSLRDDNVDIDAYLNVAESKERKNREKILLECMDFFSKIKREMYSEDEINKNKNYKNPFKIYQDYQSALLNSGGIDYDDILVYAHKILLTHEWIARIYRVQYQHVCVDEAQDLNKLQYEFIKVLCGDKIKSVLMVGDPNQMIYGFNGSSADYLCRHFINDFSPKEFTLKENYRSTKAVIQFANKLKPQSQVSLKYAFDGKAEIFEADTEEAEAQRIIDTIQQLLALNTSPEIEGEITLDKMVVIARTRFVFKVLEDHLKTYNIAYLLRQGERQQELETLIGKVLDYAIRIKVNPKDWVDGKKLCALLGLEIPSSWEHGVLGMLAQEISQSNIEHATLCSELIFAVDALDTNDPNMMKLIRDFKAKLEALTTKKSDVMTVYDQVLERSVSDLKEFERAWTQFKRKDLGDSLMAFRNAWALGQLAELGEHNGLILSTVHTMKGLEKDIVFLMGMCEGVFPDYRATSLAQIDEERNNAFVAITRAKRWLYVSYPKQRMMSWGDIKAQYKSRFVKELES